MKKILVLLVFLALPYGVNAQYSWKPDKVICNVAQDSCWWYYATGLWRFREENPIQEFDSFFVNHAYPNWQDSIERVETNIKYAEEFAENLRKAKPKVGWLSQEQLDNDYSENQLRLDIYYLQLQIFMLQQKLQKVGIE